MAIGGRRNDRGRARPACPVCRTAECCDYFTHKGMELYACEHCATVFPYPPPTAGEVVDIYHDAYDGASTGYVAKAERKLRRSCERMRYLPRYVASGSFLDIGCNEGSMVEAAKERGFEAYGLDLDGVGGNVVPLAAESKYDFRELGGRPGSAVLNLCPDRG